MTTGSSSRSAFPLRARLARGYPAMRGAAALHPLVAAAAVSVIVLSAAGIGVLTGLLPSPLARTAPEPAAAQAAPQGGRYFGRADTYPEALASRPGDAPAQPVRNASSYQPARRVTASCADCGTVQSVRAVQVKGSGSGVGAVGGGVVGGLVGNQFGGGSGRTALTVLGAVGGAFAGNEIEKHVRTTTQYQMTVRMDDGSIRSFHSSSPYAWRSGDAVRVVDGSVVSRGDYSSSRAVRVSG